MNVCGIFLRKARAMVKLHNCPFEPQASRWWHLTTKESPMTTTCRPLVAVIIVISLASCGGGVNKGSGEKTVEIEGKSYTCERLTNSKCDLRIQNAFNRWGEGIDNFVSSKSPKTPSLTTGPIATSTVNSPRSEPTSSLGSEGGTTSTTAPRSKATSSALSGAERSELEYEEVARLGLEACAVTLEGKKQNAFIDVAHETYPEQPSTAFPPLWRGAHDELCPEVAVQ